MQHSTHTIEVPGGPEFREQLLINACELRRRQEQEDFEAIGEQLAKLDPRYPGSRAYIDILGKLARLKADYAQWDLLVQQLRAIYAERGDDPENAAQFAPDRVQWQTLDARIPRIQTYTR